MALTFQTTLTTPSGLELTNAYGRVAAVDTANGDVIEAGLTIYASEAAFEAGKQAVNLPALSYARAAYNRATDGADILSLAHDILIAELANVGISATKVLD